MSEPALSFTAFVISLASSAAIHFGDLPDPASGERGELTLDGAAQMIEILALLEQKTRGNLTAEERQVLEQVLYELRLRFVEVSKPAKRIIEPYCHRPGQWHVARRTVDRLRLRGVPLDRRPRQANPSVDRDRDRA